MPQDPEALSNLLHKERFTSQIALVSGGVFYTSAFARRSHYIRPRHTRAISTAESSPKQTQELGSMGECGLT